MKSFQPTYLYIKQHAITGKCYFGKTIRNPLTYLGSGTVWRRHLNVHGTEHVETLWYKLFTDQEECTRVALLFSEQQDIVKSDRWLNLIPENGLWGQAFGFRHTAESKELIAESGRNRSPESIEKAAATHRGKHRTEETRRKMSVAWEERDPPSVETKQLISKAVSKSKMGKAQSIVKCPHCEKEGGINTMKQWHFERCKQNHMRGN